MTRQRRQTKDTTNTQPYGWKKANDLNHFWLIIRKDFPKSKNMMNLFPAHVNLKLVALFFISILPM